MIFKEPDQIGPGQAKGGLPYQASHLSPPPHKRAILVCFR
jgi:hypothetical protein